MAIKALDSAPVEPLLSIAEARAVLGVSEPTLYRLLREGKIEHIKIGTRTLFEPAQVRAFIRQRTRRRAP